MTKLRDFFAATFFLLFFCTIIASIYGWIVNIVTLLTESGLPTGELAVRLAGIFFYPLGAIMGFI